MRKIECRLFENKDLDTLRDLFREYEAYLDIDLDFQNFEKELQGLPGKYAPPAGNIIVSEVDGQIAGCVAVRPLSKDTCEMKRLYVKPEFRGLGLGRKLAVEILNLSRETGYKKMFLDTLERLKEAMHLYESLGFRQTESYYHNPLPGVIYWEIDL